MTTTIINTDTITSGTTFTFAASGDTLYVSAGTLLASTSFYAIYGSGTGYSVSVLGEVFGNDAAIRVGGDSDIYIGSTGSVTSDANASSGAVMILGTGGQLTNDGTIAGLKASGVVSRGDFTILNRGEIFGESNGVFMGLFGGTGDVLINEGSISAGLIANSDNIRYNNGVFTEGTAQIINTGTISTSSAIGAGVRIGSDIDDAGGSVIENYGDILAAAGVGVVFEGTALVGSTLLNYGVVSGATIAFSGSAGNDNVVNAGILNGHVEMGSGDDTFDGRGGRITGSVSGGLGNDTYLVDDTDIVLLEFSAAGTDIVKASASFTLADNFENLTLLGGADIAGIGNAEDNTIKGNSGNNRLQGHDGADLIYGFNGDDLIFGDSGDDVLNGGAGADILRGGLGVDTVSGGDGDDRLYGNNGDDILSGSDGADVLIGGFGSDTMAGGDGADVFVFSRAGHSVNTDAADVISDFELGVDRIDLSDLIAGEFIFIGSAAFSGTGAEVRGGISGGSTRIRIDIDGDGSSDMRIDLTGVTDLQGIDLIL